MKRTIRQLAFGTKPPKGKSGKSTTKMGDHQIGIMDIASYKPANLTDSASIIVIRRSAKSRTQYQVLMVTKTKRVDFGGSTVFPGGLTEGALDYRHAEYIQHRRHELLQKKGVSGSIRDTPNNTELLHFRINALRELFEETGLLLAQPAEEDIEGMVREREGQGQVQARVMVADQTELDGWRNRIVDDALQFELLMREKDWIPCVGQLKYWLRLQTPFNSYRRWDTHFYICEVSERDSLSVDASALGSEIQTVRWMDLDWHGYLSQSPSIPIPTRLILQELCRICDEGLLEYEMRNAHLIRHVYPIRPKAVLVTGFEEAPSEVESTLVIDSNFPHPREVKSMVMWDTDDSYHSLDLEGAITEDANDHGTDLKRVRTVQYKNKKAGLNGRGFDTIINVPRLYPYSDLRQSKL